VIGTVNFEIDAARPLAMLGFAIGRRYWKIGIGTEAAHAAIAWAFEKFDLAKIWATTDARNVRSRRLMEKLGMKCEGLLRGEEFARDGQVDAAHYGLLREEWSSDVARARGGGQHESREEVALPSVRSGCSKRCSLATYDHGAAQSQKAHTYIAHTRSFESRLR
jgi:hypothetical protein